MSFELKSASFGPLEIATFNLVTSLITTLANAEILTETQMFDVFRQAIDQCRADVDPTNEAAAELLRYTMNSIRE